MCGHQMQAQRSQQRLCWSTYRGGEPQGNSDLESRRNKTTFGGRRNGEEVGLVVAAVRTAEETRWAEKSVRKFSLQRAS